ncbi:hypothetical protein [Leptospira noguchii]|uniref:Uncharacterized protein n=1 Tax=Leptospira noguchii serovar Autumnalis str. ZUN142 TaxID=1085540 RepID=M6UAS8_9LEPT|nr:hypothetical protein [Leptospira noguchii]EMO41620.1 hypothetical protein LEP1GSC186_2049 [Leptospira noguchii serovar Autumnalis str. ZUN142]UOG50297.1 hypothetical protein MAL00_08790 [Leptospira noguchii]
MALKKPKRLKNPKKPKRSASPEVKQRYLDRLAEIEKQNKTRLSSYETRKKKDNDLNRKIYG